MLLNHCDLAKSYLYDHESGAIFKRLANGRIKLVGTLTSDGYIKVSIFGRNYFAHRLVWFYVNKVWPEKQIDHINGNRIDNRICNLRECTASENQQNRKAKPKHSSSKYLGVSWEVNRMKWKAALTLNGVRVFEEFFDSEEEAHNKYKEAKMAHHKFYVP